MSEKSNSRIALGVSVLALLFSFLVPLYLKAVDLGVDVASDVPIAVSQWSRVEAIEAEIAEALLIATEHANRQRWAESSSTLQRVALLYEQRADAATAVLVAVGALEALQESGQSPLEGLLGSSATTGSETPSAGQEEYQDRLRELERVLLSESVVTAAFDSWAAAACARSVAAVLETNAPSQVKANAVTDIIGNPGGCVVSS